MSRQTILRLRGLPWTAQEQEIRDFLHIDALAEVFLRRRGELSTGEAYVKFPSNEAAIAAQTAYNREMLGGRYIEIFLPEAESMEDLREKVREQDTGWVVRLRGLPFKATREDVLQFFGDIEVLRGVHGVTLIHGRDGRPLGEAYVVLSDEESQVKALHLDREQMGSRYIEVFKSTKADLNVRLQSARKNENARRQSWAGLGAGQAERLGLPTASPGPMVVPYGPLGSAGAQTSAISAALRLRGLPVTVTVSDIAQYFSDFGVTTGSVHISPEGEGMSGALGSSIAYVVFPSRAIADAAQLFAQQRLFQDRYIEALPAPASAAMLGLARPQQPAMAMGPGGVWSYSPVGYVYDDLSKLLTPQASGLQYQSMSPSGRPAMPLGQPLSYVPHSGMLQGQNPFGSLAAGPSNAASLQAPTSPGSMASLGQRGVFSPPPMPVMQGGSALGASQQQQLLLQQQQQQQQLFLRQQQEQQQFLLQQQQASRIQANTWGRLSNQFASGQFPTPPRPSYQARPPRLSQSPVATGFGELQTTTPAIIPDLLQGSVTSGLSGELSAQVENLSPLERIHGVPHTIMGEIPSTVPPRPELTPGHNQSFAAAASSSSLSERQSDPAATQNLSLASLHLSDPAPIGRSPAASTSPSAPSPF